jgi:MoCo/4Fe-4S cofactor protein with predicted Tat translocation signal
MSAEQLDLSAIRARLLDADARQPWRSLEAVAETPEFQEYLHREFPSNASEWLDPVGRRSFLKLMGASLALAGATACTAQPTELIVPYVRQPEQIIPGRPLFYATAMSLGGVATGLLVESHEGRPTKIEGNPEHPASHGATDLYAQASILTLYDPDRSTAITQLGEIRPWSAFIAAMRANLSAQSATGGAGFRLLTETVNSPTLAGQILQVLEEYPAAKWVQWEPLPRDHARAGARQAFGEYVEPVYDFEAADVVLSLDADFLSAGHAANLHAARGFSSRRRLGADPDRLSRLYVVEPTPSVTGGRADHRVPLKAGQVGPFARAVAARLGVAGATGAAPAGADAQVAAVAADLDAHRGRSLVLAGDAQPAWVHALAHAMNAALGNAGQTVRYLPTPEARPSEQLAALRELVVDMEAGAVQTLVILGESNPVFSAPADFRFAEAMSKVQTRMHSGLFHDETAELCHWHVPATHYLEMWSDARTFDGTVSIVQPLIQPLYGGKSPHEIVATMSERPERNGYDLVREHWQAAQGTAPDAPGESIDPAARFERAWRAWLHDGVVPDTAHAPLDLALSADWAAGAPAPEADGFEVNFRYDPSLYDGRFANNGWLQELPRPVTKLTWDNAALIGPATAERLGVRNGDLLDVAQDGRTLRVPAWIDPGHAPDSVTVTVGYGRTRAGRVGNGTGVNAYALRGSMAPHFGAAEVQKGGGRYALVSTQDHWTIEGRNIVRSETLEGYKANPEFAAGDGAPHADGGPDAVSGVGVQGLRVGHGHRHERLHGVQRVRRGLPGREQHPGGRQGPGARTAARCTGSASTATTPATSTTPTRSSSPCPASSARTRPARSSVRSRRPCTADEGLNDMVYNRCVGTRYCSNNCPYKVRRFNFLLYADWNTPQPQAAAQPGRHRAQPRRDGEVHLLRAADQRRAHPGQARRPRDPRRRDGHRVRGGLPDRRPSSSATSTIPRAGWTRSRSEPAQLRHAGELNARPRTTYLAAVRNPHPSLPVERRRWAATPARTNRSGRERALTMAQQGPTQAGRGVLDEPVLAPGPELRDDHRIGRGDSALEADADRLDRRLPDRAGGLMMLQMAIGWLLVRGVGIWGNNVPVGWAFDIINFVWWIGIGHAGTLISAILLLFKQQWRMSISRFAEAMTIFAVACAALFPLLHTGRPWLAAYWLLPYPNTMGLWPQFRSPLIWDVFAVSTYGTVSIIFWSSASFPTWRPCAIARCRR